MAKPLALIEPLLLRRLGTLGKLQPTVRHGIEEVYLAEIARSVMPDATAEEIERAKAEWRAEARLEQIRLLEKSNDEMIAHTSDPARSELLLKAPRSSCRPDLAKRLVQFMDSNVVGQSDFAKRIKVSPRTISNFIRTGKAKMSIVNDISNAILPK